MNKVECLGKSRIGKWYESMFNEEGFLSALERNNSGFVVHYRIVDDKGNVLRLFNLEGGKLVEDTTAKVEPNMEHEGYYYNPVAVPWHEAVEDIIKNDAVYLCKYTNAPTWATDFRVTHNKKHDSTELGFDDGTTNEEFKLEHQWFTAKWHKEVGKVQPKPQGKLKDGLWFTHSGDKKPLKYDPKAANNASSGWILVYEGLDACGNYSVVKDGVVVRTYSIVEGK